MSNPSGAVPGKETVKFYFDPVCPWAWRASLWMREVQQVRPVNVEWDFLSLQAVNSGKESLKETHFRSEKGFRIMALLRRKLGAEEANTMIDKLYLELGQAQHERKEDIGEDAVVEKALSNLGLDTGLLQEAMSDPTTLDDVQKSHEGIVGKGGFGVPTLVMSKANQELKPAFGPVIDRVPTGEDAGQLWDRVEWLMQRPEFFELKRSR
ncbi:MAG TPA: DsbA family protein [Chloroflexia bacterium]|nr:DsbA family protein [Chloroflexia bacterium]